METAQTIAIRCKIVGILVKRARIDAGKSMRECSELLGCSPAIYSRYEQGNRGFSLPQLEALAHFFDVPLASLWDDGHVSPGGTQDEALPMAQIIALRRRILAVKLRQCRQTAGLSQREMSQLLGRTVNMVSLYERGMRDIPLAELEVVAERCGHSLVEFMDEETIPPSQAEQQRRIMAQLDALPPDVREFVLSPTNALYLRIAMLLSTMKADHLRQIAEALLDITY
jgi:transcriptional regulator with XRE-family HTH domain